MQHQTKTTSENLFFSQQMIEIEKQHAVESELEKLDNIFSKWLNHHLNPQKKVTISTMEMKKDCSSSQQPTIGEETKRTFEKKTRIFHKFLQKLSTEIISENLYKIMTRKEINDFFSEIETQLKNKKKLYDDIRKLNSKNDSKNSSCRTYSKQQILILKKWLMEHYHNPYPSKQEICQMVTSTDLTQKQVLNWFINARNALKNKQERREKFGDLITSRLMEINSQKKIKL